MMCKARPLLLATSYNGSAHAIEYISGILQYSQSLYKQIDVRKRNLRDSSFKTTTIGSTEMLCCYHHRIPGVIASRRMTVEISTSLYIFDILPTLIMNTQHYVSFQLFTSITKTIDSVSDKIHGQLKYKIHTYTIDK